MHSNREYLHQLRYFTRGYEYYIIFLFVLALITGLIESFSIALLYPMISEGFQIQSNSIPFYSTIEKIGNLIPIGTTFVHLGLIFVLLTGISLLLQLLYWKVAFFFKKEIVVNIKKNLFLKINANDYLFFIESKQGDLINLFNQNPYYIEQTLDRLLSLCADSVTSIIVIVMLFYVSPGGILLVMIGGGGFYLLLNKIGKSISEKIGQLQIASGKSENKVINEYISGVKTIQALHASYYWQHQYDEALKIYWDKYADLMFIQRIPIIAINSLFYITIGICVLVLYIYCADDFMRVIPVLGTFAAGTMKVLPKFMNMGDYKLQLKNFLPSVQIVYSYLHDTQYQKLKNGSHNFVGLDTDISLKGLKFGYGHNTILNNINFEITKGSMTALVGSSGSGKTTIASLILRLYDPKEGGIYLNGRNLKDFEIGSYRDLIGYVSQDSFIFNDTIRSNIAFGRDYSEYEIIEAAKLAQADEFIQNLPDGYDSVVGDQGITLSGGEKQRLAIARAMIRRPVLLILDEATSALDNISEMAVQQAIDTVARECTTLVIAHRLSTVENADKIILIDKGKIIEEGTHNQLMENKGKYWELYSATKERGKE